MSKKTDSKKSKLNLKHIVYLVAGTNPFLPIFVELLPLL